MEENLVLFTGTTYTDFEQATAEQIAVAGGRETPNARDFLMAVQKAKLWNIQRKDLNLASW